MSTYSFRIKKDKYILELVTTDKELLVSQFELWVKDSDAYAKRKKAENARNMVSSQIKAEEEITKKNIETQIANHQSAETANVEQSIDEVREKQEPKAEEQKPIKDDLDIFYAPPAPQEDNKETINEKQEGVFDNILENSMNKPMTELSFKPSPSIKKDSAYLNFINSRNIEKKIDFLLLTAYYFTQYEQKPRFTLKQLNSKLMQNVALIIDHSVLQEAINRDYIECLPDLTGLVGASEYRLTAYGEKTIMDE